MLIKQIVIGVGSASLFAAVMTGLWYGVRATSLTITEVVVTGGVTISHEEVEAITRQELAGTYGKFIPKAFTYFYPHDAVVTAVGALPRVKNPVVTRTNATSLLVTIDEYIPEALWCEERGKSRCFFVDEYGYAFGEAPPLVGSAFVRYHTQGRVPSRGEILTDSAQLASVEAITKALDNQLSWPVLIVDLDTAGDEFYILPGKSEVRISKSIDATTTIENLKAVLTADEFKDLRPGDFSYIDLRFGSKVFINDIPPDSVSATTTVTTTDMTESAVEE